MLPPTTYNLKWWWDCVREKNQILYRGTQGTDKKHCRSSQHGKFLLVKKKQRFTTRTIKHWDVLPRQIVISTPRDLEN